MLATAPGKLILFGEHAVVYGEPGVVAAIGLQASVECKLRDAGIIINAVDYGKKVDTDYAKCVNLLEKVESLRRHPEEIKKLAKDFSAPIKILLAKAMDSCEYYKGLELRISSEIPRASGLGSGSAVFAAVAASVCSSFGGFSRGEIEEMAFFGDVVAHGGTPSGIDSSAVVNGGYLWFSKERGTKPFDTSPNIPVVIGDTGVRSSTAEMVSKVRRRIKKHEIAEAIKDIGAISERAVLTIRDEDLAAIGRLMNQNQELLRMLGVSHPKLDALIKASLGAGASGAKLSGAGGGGVMFAVGEDREKIANAIQSAGGKAIITELGADGVSAG
jgi:mevalonate kinase